MTQRFRFAPSPTGYLHVGNARTAIVTWLAARAAGGTFLLRIDDTDAERSRQEYEVAIEEDLRWLGITWDDKANQKDRLARYGQEIERLKAAGRLYPCYETAEELGLKRRAALTAGRPPIYDRAALALTDAQKAAHEAAGRAPHWRFKLEPGEIAWDDAIRGPVRFDAADMADPVLIREDGSPLYHLCSVIDDIDFGITCIVRGEDHVANTAAHVQMFRALGAAPPAFAHLPLVTAAGGDKLSKRAGSLSIRDLREGEGLEPMAIVSLLARLGTSEPIEAFAEPGPLVESFGFAKFSRNAPKFDAGELLRLNARLLHDAPFAAVAHALPPLSGCAPSSLPPLSGGVTGGVTGAAGADHPPLPPPSTEGWEALWGAVRGNIERARDAADWAPVAYGDIEPAIEDAGFIAAAAALLPPGPWDEHTWAQWADAVKAATGRKGKALYLPLRLALTGRAHGPEMAALLPLIGPDRARARLSHDA
jgi:glutamyl-tRNA synthetase